MEGGECTTPPLASFGSPRNNESRLRLRMTYGQAPHRERGPRGARAEADADSDCRNDVHPDGSGEGDPEGEGPAETADARGRDASEARLTEGWDVDL